MWSSVIVVVVASTSHKTTRYQRRLWGIIYYSATHFCDAQYIYEKNVVVKVHATYTQTKEITAARKVEPVEAIMAVQLRA